jgi:hypothetical protein
MPEHAFIYRPTKTDADHLEKIRKVMTVCCDALKQPLPDTFLGRKTQEPFPRLDAE